MKIEEVEEDLRNTARETLIMGTFLKGKQMVRVSIDG